MKVHTWADGFGNWHAEVTEQGVGDAHAARRMARAAIVGELAARENDEWFASSRLTVKQVSRVSLDGILVTEFVEEWSE
jgi:hypothetical protein